MDKKVILHAMEYIDPKLIEEANSCVKVRHVGLRKCLLIAACVSALILTSAFAAAVIFAVPDVEQVDQIGVDGVGIGGTGIVPSLNLEQDSKVSSDLFNKEFLMDVSNTPDGERFDYCFGEWSTMESYIGYNIFDNPVLDGARKTQSRYGFNGVTRETHGYLYCFRSGRELSSVNVSASYELNPTQITTKSGTFTYWVSVHITASVDTELSTREHGFSSYNFPEGTEITEESYTSPNGHTFTIIRVLSEDWSGPTFYSFLYLDHAYIAVRTIFPQDEAQALATMKEVLDGFVIG